MVEFIQSSYSIEDLENFRDENGFIDLSNANINFTPESREKMGTAARLKNWVNFNGKKALLRGEAVDNYSVYAELIVEEIAKELGIEAAHYDLIKIKDQNGNEIKGVLSESIIDFEKEELTTLHDLIGDEPASENEIEDIDYISATRYEYTIEKLTERLQQSNYNKETIDDIIKDYKKRLVFYLSVLDTDKHPENISFVRGKDGNIPIRLSANYDSEFSLLLEIDPEMAQFFTEDIEQLKDEVDVAEPKIGIIVSKENGGWNSMWKDTLEKLLEDDEIYDYYNENIRGKIDMDKIFQKVEERIKAKIPEQAKKLAKNAYYSRNEKIEKIMDGELEIEESYDIADLLNSLIDQGITNEIRTSEQIDIGKQMERDASQQISDNYLKLFNKIQSDEDGRT